MPTLSASSAFQILKNYFGGFVAPPVFPAITVIADNSYSTMPNPDWLRNMVLHEPILSPARYRRDIFDCDDYVMFLKTRVSLFAANKGEFTSPIAMGFLLTRIHAFNFALLDNNSLYLLNTQSNTVDFLIPQDAQQAANFLGLSANNPLKFIYL